jgi:hypothetical protein
MIDAEYLICWRARARRAYTIRTTHLICNGNGKGSGVGCTVLGCACFGREVLMGVLQYIVVLQYVLCNRQWPLQPLKQRNATSSISQKKRLIIHHHLT